MSGITVGLSYRPWALVWLNSTQAFSTRSKRNNERRKQREQIQRHLPPSWRHRLPHLQLLRGVEFPFFNPLHLPTQLTPNFPIPRSYIPACTHCIVKPVVLCASVCLQSASMEWGSYRCWRRKVFIERRKRTRTMLVECSVKSLNHEVIVIRMKSLIDWMLVSYITTPVVWQISRMIKYISCNDSRVQVTCCVASFKKNCCCMCASPSRHLGKKIVLFSFYIIVVVSGIVEIPHSYGAYTCLVLLNWFDVCKVWLSQ